MKKEEKNEAVVSEVEARSEAGVGMSRRTLCVGVAGAAAVLGLGGLRFVGSTPVVRPPGGQDEDQLISACIRCQKCFEICPHGVIRPSHVENGILGMRTPELNFSESWCDWCEEANGGVPLCAEVCPTQALKLPEGATVEETILGKAELDMETCLAYRMIGCRFCYDVCPYEAMGLDENNRPYVIPEKCNGCGACEAVCVSLQNASISLGATERAIVVRPYGE
ncbi:4Fe-4S dicluster domain-containing protein [Adlercreutzia sp. ZJ138]|uniref:4Fe-4S dicluster domain-containing protein n=1 Tax=Adlercreutzia sp. ZJ138 TaxID=2709405 RepID=UPI0013EC12ED|nr:4Fe-4S dicluster domain-containing protein [Adlercreutzia sp. ZJ138]